jgi:hypothetical protein
VSDSGQAPEGKRPRWLKYLRLCAGFLVLAAGIVLSLPLVPGPGIPLVLFGLLLLSDHFVWAQKALAWTRQKWDRIRNRQ